VQGSRFVARGHNRWRCRVVRTRSRSVPETVLAALLNARSSMPWKFSPPPACLVRSMLLAGRAVSPLRPWAALLRTGVLGRGPARATEGGRTALPAWRARSCHACGAGAPSARGAPNCGRRHQRDASGSAGGRRSSRGGRPDRHHHHRVPDRDGASASGAMLCAMRARLGAVCAPGLAPP